MEYASEVWFNCGQFNSNRLEKVQIEAARIVCGFHCYASIASIYKETRWDKLKVRREVKNLTLFYKIFNYLAPEYLSDLIHQQFLKLQIIIYVTVKISVNKQISLHFSNNY